MRDRLIRERVQRRPDPGLLEGEQARRLSAVENAEALPEERFGRALARARVYAFVMGGR